MDKTDRLKVSHSLETVRTGVETRWKNPDTGYQYRVVPTRTYEEPEGPCREYTVDASIGGKTEQIYGTACRQADGSWQVKS
jgi:surface antigen